MAGLLPFRATAGGPLPTYGMNHNAIPLELTRALTAPVPAVATDQGAVAIVADQVLELLPVSAGTWGWRTEAGEWWLVPVGLA